MVGGNIFMLIKYAHHIDCAPRTGE